MNTYTITLEVLTPVYIGSGNSILKKDYILKGNYIEVYNPYKLYSILGKQYEIFLNDNSTLTDFSYKNRINIESAIEYKIYCGDTGVRKSDSIEEFIKDPYGCPYIPGSSIKGAIRTAILSGIVKKKEEKKDKYSEFRKRPVDNRDNIEKVAFGEIVEDKFKHIKISDSLPLSLEDLVLSKKIDVFVDGKTNNKINICREALKVGTKVQFTITIDGPDEKNWNKPWTQEQIMGSIKNFALRYRKDYINKFTPITEDYGGEIIYLGGGTGFVTKTVNYSLYGDEAVDKISDYLAQKFGNHRKPDMHNHKKDKQLGVSPHMKKCTKADGKIVEMGICRIRID